MPRKIPRRRHTLRPHPRFNGAEAVMPRKICSSEACGYVGHRLQWGRGSDASEDSASVVSTVITSCFNGAEAVMPRKIRLPKKPTMWCRQLQWGRGSDASEDAQAAPACF